MRGKALSRPGRWVVETSNRSLSGYPCSSFQFRHFMAALGDRWRLIAPDLPGFGYSGTPDPGSFDYSFAGYGERRHLRGSVGS
jgi:pimeloyl-ACP methyl ester carboxylesterase